MRERVTECLIALTSPSVQVLCALNKKTRGTPKTKYKGLQAISVKTNYTKKGQCQISLAHGAAMTHPPHIHIYVKWTVSVLLI